MQRYGHQSRLRGGPPLPPLTLHATARTASLLLPAQLKEQLESALAEAQATLAALTEQPEVPQPEERLHPAAVAPAAAAPASAPRRAVPGSSNARIHPRSKYAYEEPDFAALAELYPSLRPFLLRRTGGSSDGSGGADPSSADPSDAQPPPQQAAPPRASIDFTSPAACRELTRVLLRHDFGAEWWVPLGQLVPPLTNRANYIHWLQDLLGLSAPKGGWWVGSTILLAVAGSCQVSRLVPGRACLAANAHMPPRSPAPRHPPPPAGPVVGLDIGCGANLIYPLLGATLCGWRMLGVDCTPVALEWASRNLGANPQLAQHVELRAVGMQPEQRAFLDAAAATGGEGEGASSGKAAEPGQSVGGVQGAEAAAQATAEAAADAERAAAAAAAAAESEREAAAEEALAAAPAVATAPPARVLRLSAAEAASDGIIGSALRRGERVAFCMCNPPFFESLDEAGRNPATAYGGTAAEMVYPGGHPASRGHIARRCRLRMRQPHALRHAARRRRACLCLRAGGRFAAAAGGGALVHEHGGEEGHAARGAQPAVPPRRACAAYHRVLPGGWGCSQLCVNLGFGMSIVGCAVLLQPLLYSPNPHLPAGRRRLQGKTSRWALAWSFTADAAAASQPLPRFPAAGSAAAGGSAGAAAQPQRAALPVVPARKLSWQVHAPAAAGHALLETVQQCLQQAGCTCSCDRGGYSIRGSYTATPAELAVAAGEAGGEAAPKRPRPDSGSQAAAAAAPWVVELHVFMQHAGLFLVTAALLPPAPDGALAWYGPLMQRLQRALGEQWKVQA